MNPRVRWLWTTHAIVVMSLLWVAVAPPAQAVVIYEYTGNTFTFGTSTDRVTASIVLSNSLDPDMDLGLVTPQSFTFAAGTETSISLTLSDASPNLRVQSFFFTTDSSGAITGWQISATQNPVSSGQLCGTITVDCISISSRSDSAQVLDDARQYIANANTYIGQVANNPGTWAIVPEPSTASLAGLGLLALGAIGRRRRS